MKKSLALVTGANRGIGKAITYHLAQNGFDLVLVSKDEVNLSKLSHTIKEKYSIDVHAYALDFAKPESIESNVQEIANQFPNVEVLINNAGIYTHGTLGVKNQQIEEVLRVNVMSQLVFLNAFIPKMKARNYGQIINVVSRAAKSGLVDRGIYVASKYAFLGLSDTLTRELALENIRVSAICPSFVDTELAKDAGSPLASNEMIQCEDINKTVDWLLSLSPQVVVPEIVLYCRELFP